ncbi:hypothetical protein X798_04153 [Onchocerca flexuosa]|uniref:Uncharacterized protein n=1 Tax=Onchocerca flexuosa TaxID=387005 RepID=A0A238BW69_9BILA|nr:hypothetical protein X798_04153 [Onchocerca flexuosa]
MEASTMRTAILHEPSSAFDPDREMKDRKLAQIFKKLHMEQATLILQLFNLQISIYVIEDIHDLNTLLDFDDSISRPSQVALNHVEESNADKTERCRPRKILDYAVLAKGQSYRNNLVGSFASSCSETGGASKSGAGCKRIRFQKDRFDDNTPTFSVKRRSRNGRYASALKKNNRSRRFSFPLAATGVKKKETSRSRSFAGRIKRGILKRRMKDANNIKQAFLISKKILDMENQHFKEFILPEKWIKESQKRKKMKMKSGEEESTGSASIEDLAMERLVRAFKTAKLLYPEKFAEYFPDFVHCFEPDDDREKRDNKNGVMSKQTHFKTIKSEEDAFDKNIASDSGDDLSKRIRKLPKILRDYSTGVEIKRKKLAGSKEKCVKEQIPSVTRKVSRIGGSLAGTSGLRKRSRTVTDSPSNQSMLSKFQQNEKTENIKGMEDLEEIGRIPTSKKRKYTKSNFLSNASVVKVTNVNATIIQNNIEDSATESSSDESGNMRSSKRQRAQSGFYKTMVTLYDKKRS